MIVRRRITGENTQLQMSAMIDIVFLLLVFFVMTFKITAIEGDFFVASQQQGYDNPATFDVNLPLRLHISADVDGEIKKIRLNHRIVANLDALQNELRRIIQQAVGNVMNAETQLVIFECDSHLRYDWTIEAMTAIKRCEIDGVSFDIRLQSS